jgi:hypothetical protein
MEYRLIDLRIDERIETRVKAQSRRSKLGGSSICGSMRGLKLLGRRCCLADAVGLIDLRIDERIETRCCRRASAVFAGLIDLRIDERIETPRTWKKPEDQSHRSTRR